MPRETRTKRFLGYTLKMDSEIEMWSNDRELDEVTITLNKHSEDSWTITILKGNASLIGVGKNERLAREDLVRKMKDLRHLLGYFKE